MVPKGSCLQGRTGVDRAEMDDAPCVDHILLKYKEFLTLHQQASYRREKQTLGLFSHGCYSTSEYQGMFTDACAAIDLEKAEHGSAFRKANHKVIKVEQQEVKPQTWAMYGQTMTTATEVHFAKYVITGCQDMKHCLTHMPNRCIFL